MLNLAQALENIKKGVLQPDSQEYFQLSYTQSVLALFAQNFGLRKLTEEDTQTLIRLIQETNSTTKHLLKERLSFFLVSLLQCDFVWRTDEEAYLKHNPADIAANIFTAYWTILSYTNNAQNLMPIDESLKNKFAFWLKKAQLFQANLEYQDLSYVNLAHARLKKPNFSFANLTGALLAYAQFEQADFSGAILQKAQLSHSKIIQSKFVGANLSEAALSYATLWQAELYGANMQGIEAIEANLSQTLCRNSSLKEATLIQANFSDADLSYVDLSKATAIRTDFSHSNLTSATLFEANLMEANLNHTRLQGADLRAKNFTKTQFFFTDLEVTAKEFVKNRGALST